MIRQAISCDICGAEKKQTNHWFVACEQAGELRVSGWNSRNRLRTGSKHLCGQTCLHKLVDEFMARSIAGRIHTPVAADKPEAEPARADLDTSLTSAYADDETSARLIPTPVAHASPAPLPPAILAARAAAVVSMPARPISDAAVSAPVPIPVDDASTYSSRRWRAEAWERERNRELRAVERHPDILRRRKGI